MPATDWTAGYVADVNYTFGYYPELNPLRARLGLLNHGLEPPVVRTACELGFGQGLSVNIHAAASDVEWYGTDFNPSQASFAQGLAKASGSDAKLFDEAFSEFAARADLPDFDFISLHGIWSWISDDNRAVLIDFVRRKLRPGGLLYVSYNTLPGWASFVPMRRLLTEYAEALAPKGASVVDRIEQALTFADQLIATNAGYGRANPQAAERLKKLREQDRQYLAHEYFNRDWLPMHFSSAAELLRPAKVSFACSAHYLDHVEGLNLTAEQLAFLNEIKDPMFRELSRDFIVNQQFRRDYWIKGPRRMSVLERTEALQQERFVLAAPRPNVSLKVGGALGEGSLNEKVYAPILDFLADHKVRSLGEIAQAVAKDDISFAQVVEATVVLSSTTQAAAAQTDQLAKQARPKTDKLNAYLRSRARSHGETSFLASPVTGAGVAVGRFEQLFLTAFAGGQREPKAWAEDAWTIIAAQGQKIVKNGATLDTPEENLAELETQAQAFSQKLLPGLRALGVA